MFGRVLMGACTLVACGWSAEVALGQMVPVPLGSAATNNLRLYTLGSDYPVAPVSITVGGVPFDLTPQSGSPNSLGILEPPTGNSQVSVFTSVTGAARVYTLINSGTGQFGAVNGRVEVLGTNGAFASFTLTQGVNIRDHREHIYNNVINDPGIATMTFGARGARLDRQTFELPATFLTETLTEVRLVATNAGNPQGFPFLAGATVEVGAQCDSLDFNNDTLTPDSGDLDDFLAVLAGGPAACSTFPTPGCNDLDFNNDGLFPDSLDLDAFINRLGGGPCVR